MTTKTEALQMLVDALGFIDLPDAVVCDGEVKIKISRPAYEGQEVILTLEGLTLSEAEIGNVISATKRLDEDE